MSRFLSILDRFLLVLNLISIILGSVTLFRALGVPALGVLILCWMVARPLARFLQLHPLSVYESRPGVTGAVILNLLLVLLLPTGSLARTVGGIFGALLIVLVLWPKGPSDRLKRRLSKLTPKLRRFGRPVMGGAS